MITLIISIMMYTTGTIVLVTVAIAGILEVATADFDSVMCLLQSMNEKLDHLKENGCGSRNVIAGSCQQIKNQKPSSTTGIYQLATPSGKTNLAYCHMGELCGTEGGWTRLAYLDMSDSMQKCPTEFRLYESDGVRACGRATNDGGSCQSVRFPSNGISYSQVCGKVIGYQFGSPDGIRSDGDIDSQYVDGVSITSGSPRKHIWTLIGGLYESKDYSYDPPSFVGKDFYCESGNPSSSSTWDSELYADNPLWDGKGCSNEKEYCCKGPWFNKVLGTATTEYIELRVCGDEGTDNENAPVSLYEIYVK